MDKLKMHSPDFTEENITKLAELFPNCVTEAKGEDGEVKRAIDFDLLRQELSRDLVEGPQERYRLDWPGKREALALANAPIAKTLRPCREESVEFGTTKNLYIEGDNLDALKLLQETYLGQVKMIYIDPPYNTGNDFIYDDNYSMTRAEYERNAGVLDEEGNALFDEEKWQQNSSARGRFHSEWLSMMYPRLKLARNLLKDDGVIYMSIDDGEVANLRAIGNEVFGSHNFIANIIWEKKYTRANDARWFSDNHDHILCFAKNKESVQINQLPRTEDQLKSYKNPDSHPKGRWKSTPLHAKSGTNTQPFKFKNGVSWSPPPGTFRRFNDEAMKRMDETDEIWFGADGNQTPSRKSFLCDVKGGVTPITIWSYQEAGHNHEANTNVKDLGMGGLFDNPKPVRLLLQMLRLSTDKENSDIVLDFFSGSGTTAEAVMRMNAEDGGNRRFIQVQLPEPCPEKSNAFANGYRTIAEISRERIRRAGAKVNRNSDGAENGLFNQPVHDSADPDIGFRSLRVDTTSISEVYTQPDELTQGALDLQVNKVKPDRSSWDLLFQVLLDWGVDLSLPISEKTIGGKQVLCVAETALVACFEKELDESFFKVLAQIDPLRIVVADSSICSDSLRINIEQICKTLCPNTELRVL